MSTSSDFAKLLLRLMIGGLMLFHGIAKLNYGISSIEGLLASHNWPSFLAYGVYVGEILAPILLIIGFQTRISGFIIALTMGVAIYLVHSTDIFEITKTGGWAIELQMIYLISAVSIMLLGAGKFAFDKEKKW
ncbi:MAG: DoxX family protein [Arcobacteraceae bacterium]